MKALRGYDAIMQNIRYTGLGCKLSHGSRMILGQVRLDRRNPKVDVALNEPGSGGMGTRFRIARYGRIAIDDKVAVRHDGTRSALRRRRKCQSTQNER